MRPRHHHLALKPNVRVTDVKDLVSSAGVIDVIELRLQLNPVGARSCLRGRESPIPAALNGTAKIRIPGSFCCP